LPKSSGGRAVIWKSSEQLPALRLSSPTPVTGVNANGTTCRHFYYDNSTGYAGIPTGVTTPAYPYGRMVEAATDACATTRTSSTLITDEWFSYDKDGRATTQWESTPHSGTYYKAVATYTGPALTAVQLANPSLYTMTYGLEGEGRWSTLTDTTASQNIVTKTTFNAAGQPLNIQLTGTTPDQDIYTYDSNTGNMKTFEFEVGNTPANLTGTLSWNPNGTLGQLAVTDGFNADGTETCYSNSSGSLGYGYDDLERLIEFDCGSGHWGQEFTYDQYDNLSKTVISGRTGTTWNPGYSATTNHCTGCAYDSNGDVTGDGNDVYGWNEFSKVKWTATSGTPTCGSSGRCATYDAFGRMVEASVNSTWHTYWYTQTGKIVMGGTTPSYGRWPTSVGTVETLDTTCCSYLHSDWLGNSRIVSNTSNHTVTADQAYTPYGEIYNIFGANNSEYQVFAGTIGDLAPSTTTPIMWDTPNRELSYVGRWLSPDPAGAGWNQYAYPTNPNSEIDPLGLAPPCPVNPNCSLYPTGANPSVGQCTVSIDFGGPAPCGVMGGLLGSSESTATCPPGVTSCVYVNGPNGGILKWGNCAYDDGGIYCDNAVAVDNFGCANYVMANCGPANNGPNKITCATVLPDGSTVGSHVNSVLSSLNNSATADAANPVLEAQSGLNPISVMSQVYSGLNFKMMYMGSANAQFLGNAGNFAYGAVSADLGVPLWATELIAGQYAKYAGHPDRNNPYGMDNSANNNVPAGYGAKCGG
jgi:hypothetical protein